MKYTKYFSAIVKDQGKINVDTYQFQRMMNIVHIEGTLAGMNKIKKTLEGTKEHYKYDMLIFKKGKQLTELTGNLEPNLLLKEMIQLSR